jgi:hypothetical protein
LRPPCRKGAGAETFVRAFKLLEHIQTRAFVRLGMQELVLNLRGLVEFLLDLAQARLAFLNRAARRLHIELLCLDVEREFLEADLEPVTFFFELNFFRGKFFDPASSATTTLGEMVGWKRTGNDSQ